MRFTAAPAPAAVAMLLAVLAALAAASVTMLELEEAPSSSGYDSPVPRLTPPKTVHIAIVADSINGTLGLNLPCNHGSFNNRSAGCERRRRLLTALTSFAGVALRQRSSEGLFLPANADQLRWLHRLAAVRPGLTFVHHANSTIWEVMAAMHQQQAAERLPLLYVQYDVDKNRDSLAAARMATSRLNATMLDATLVAEAEARGWKQAPNSTAEGVT